MNTPLETRSLIGPLVAKDWQLVRGPMAGYAALGLVSLGLLSIDSQLMFTIGAILLLTLVVIVGAHLVMVTVVKERGQQTLPFVMSLPITPMQYTAAKLAANLGMFLAAWAAVLAAVVGLLLASERLPDGLVPYAVIVMSELFIAFALTLAVALISESEAWTVVVMSVGNVSISIFMITLARIPAIGQFMMGDVPVWNGTALSILAAEAALIALIVAATFWVQSRKRDFL